MKVIRENIKLVSWTGDPLDMSHSFPFQDTFIRGVVIFSKRGRQKELNQKVKGERNKNSNK